MAKKTSTDSMLKGNAGEFYVLAELSRREWTAAQTPRNTRDYDVLALKNGKQIAVRVKTKTADSKSFTWQAKKDKVIFRNIILYDFCILVDIPRIEFPEFFIVPTVRMDTWLRAEYDAWVKALGVKGPRDPENRDRRIYMDTREEISHGYKTKLSPYRANWALLEDSEKYANAEEEAVTRRTIPASFSI
jgi:hypothetical protein